MHHEEMNQAFETMDDTKEQLQQCVEQCRAEAEDISVAACKSTILNVAFACEAQTQNIDRCIELCRSEAQEEAA